MYLAAGEAQTVRAGSGLVLPALIVTANQAPGSCKPCWLSTDQLVQL